MTTNLKSESHDRALFWQDTEGQYYITEKGDGVALIGGTLITFVNWQAVDQRQNPFKNNSFPFYVIKKYEP